MNIIDIKRDVIRLRFAVFSLVLFILLVPITTITAFASTESSIFEIQRLLNLTNTSLMRGDLDSSLGSLNNAQDLVQELKEEDENTDNSSNDASSSLEVERGSDETNSYNGVAEGSVIDDNVERSQECVENTGPGEVCALS